MGLRRIEMQILNPKVELLAVLEARAHGKKDDESIGFANLGTSLDRQLLFDGEILKRRVFVTRNAFYDQPIARIGRDQAESFRACLPKDLATHRQRVSYCPRC